MVARVFACGDPMPALEIGQSPPLTLPGRFLATVPLWGIGASVLLALLGPAPWASRWHPGVLALVHMLVLGVIGNACIGALLQFLSAAAGSRPAGSARLWMGLHAIYNLGVFALSLGLLRMEHRLLWPAVPLLTVSICGAALAILAGLRAGRGERWLRVSLAVPLLAWCLAAALGAALIASLSGCWSANPFATTDAHALVGVGGVFVLLLVAVGRMVLPMLLGVAQWRARSFVWSYAALTLLVATAACWRLFADDGASPLRIAAAALLVIATVAMVALRRRVRARNRPLAFAWGFGLALAHVAAWALLIAPERAGLVPMTALLGVALPLLVLSTLLEISAFIAWIDLHLLCGRGIQVPGVHLLMPDAGKWRWLVAQCVAGTSLLALVIHPTQALAVWAGVAGVVSYTLLALLREQPRRHARRFLLLSR